MQEAVRRKLACELHDQIGQSLGAIKMNLECTQEMPGSLAVRPRLNQSIMMVEQTMQQVRNLVMDLRPPDLDELGLVTALRWYLGRRAEQASLEANFASNPSTIHLPPTVETTCFRVAQEALNNIVRHARARRVDVDLRQRKDELQLMIRDDGSGFDVSAARKRISRGESFGLLSMEERAQLVGGSVKIESAPGCGTEVRVVFPFGLPV
ncbi:MAG: hypothetical protein JWR26_2054 [Pedosphaera sp.]|nr:hypothetical protein [Pedosphaera sp.]